MQSAPPELEPGRQPRVDVVGRHRGLVLRTAIVSLLTLASRLAGFVRETLAASIFGDASPINDAFVTAWRVPNLFRSLLGEGAMSASLQTALTQEDAEHGLEAGRRLFWALARVVGALALALCALVMLAAWLMPDRMPFTDWSWLGSDPAPVRELVVRMMPFVVLVCLAAVVGGALQVRGHFASTALAPVLMNLWWITALFLVIREFGFDPRAETAAEYGRQMDIARRLAWYVLVAGVILLCVQLPALRGRGLIGTSRRAGTSAAGVPSDAGAAAREREQQRERLAARVWHVLRSATPLALGAAVYQVNVMVDGLMAESLLPNGGPSILYYATRVQQLPMSLVSAAATAAVFPSLAALGQQRRLGELRKLHVDTHLAIAFAAVPAVLGLIVFAEPIMSVCFEHGAFGSAGVERGAAGLRALALAILPAGAAGLVARTYYALGDFRTPVRISVGVLLANIGLNVAFVVGLGMDVEGLALATALSAWANLLLLLPGLRHRFGPHEPSHGVPGRLARILIAAGGATGLGWLLWALLRNQLGQTTDLLLSIALTAAAYALLAQLLQIPEWRAVLDRARPRGAKRPEGEGRRN